MMVKTDANAKGDEGSENMPLIKWNVENFNWDVFQFILFVCLFVVARFLFFFFLVGSGLFDLYFFSRFCSVRSPKLILLDYFIVYLNFMLSSSTALFFFWRSLKLLFNFLFTSSSRACMLLLLDWKQQSFQCENKRINLHMRAMFWQIFPVWEMNAKYGFKNGAARTIYRLYFLFLFSCFKHY